VKANPFDGVILDGELVVLNESGHPSFNKLQTRAKLGAREAKRAAIESPATLYVFDLLAFAGYDLRKLPLVKRKEILQKVLPQTGPLRYSEHFEKNGEALYEQVVKLGLEGIMAKKADSPYRSGRSGDWLKIRADRIDDFVVVGFSKPKGSRGGFGSLHVGAYNCTSARTRMADSSTAGARAQGSLAIRSTRSVRSCKRSCARRRRASRRSTARSPRVPITPGSSRSSFAMCATRSSRATDFCGNQSFCGFGMIRNLKM